MTNRAILITGSQRSGTTMLSLALDSHPDVVSVDELQFRIERMREYLNAPEFAPNVCFKLPVAAASLWFVESVNDMRVLWMLRDPRAVVASMIRLPLELDGRAVPWAAHPAGALVEIANAVEALAGVPPELTGEWERYSAKAKTLPEQWSPVDLVRSAALCWRLKNELPRFYDRAGIAYTTVEYEKLVHDPQGQLRAILEYLGLDWHDDVLRHHVLHLGVSVGQTDNTRAIDTRSTDKWQRTLGADELALIRRICGVRASAFGYAL